MVNLDVGTLQPQTVVVMIVEKISALEAILLVMMAYIEIMVTITLIFASVV